MPGDGELGDDVEVVAAFLAAIRPVVAESTAGSGENGQFEQVASTAFNSWITVLAERLTATGLPADEAGDLATTLITVLDGAHVLCRAAGSREPYEQAARTIAGLVRTS